MSRTAADAIFRAMFALTDIRVLLRESAPDHELDESQRAQVQDLIRAIRQQIDLIEREMLR
jgi:hypothetical protein